MSFLLLINMSYYLIDLYPSKTLIIGKIKYEIYRKLFTDTTNLLYHLIKCFFLCIKLGGSAMKLNMNKEELKKFLLHAPQVTIIKYYENIHPVDILDILRDYPEDRSDILCRLPEELIAQVNQTATAFVKSIVAGQLLINPDVSMDEQADVVNQTIQDSGMIKQINHCMSQTYDVTLIHLMALELRKKVEAALYPYIARKNCLVADLDDIEKEPIIYNTLTKQVYENDHWIDRELDLKGKLLIYTKTEERKAL